MHDYKKYICLYIGYYKGCIELYAVIAFSLQREQVRSHKGEVMVTQQIGYILQ